MSDAKLMTGRDLGQAICKHFGLNAGLVQSDYQIKTDLHEIASITLTISLTPEDLVGIARAAAGDEPQASTQELKLKVDISSLGDLIERMERYAQEHYGCAAAVLGSVEAIQGEAPPIEPDPRLDEIVTLLKRIDGHLNAPVRTVLDTPGN